MSAPFELPRHLEATRPPAERDAVRLLISTPSGVFHNSFLNLGDHLRPGDLLVVNDSATLPSALGNLHVSADLGGGRWVVEPRGGPPQPTLNLPDEVTARLERPYRGSKRLWEASVDADRVAYLLKHGEPIRYAYMPGRWPLREYQTIFARAFGSAEMPSAGRPFSPRVVRDLKARGVRFARVTLHTGVSSLENHEEPYPEPFHVPDRTLRAIQGARRVIAVGTTVLRALESAAAGRREGWTDLVIRPGRRLCAHGLITGFHEPRSTHLWMLEALAGGGHVQSAYREALDHGYLWHEFGDSHLLLAA
ncbi:MAG: S-adenosylmethionine:tRNA ribosyltransferase-isomerase [Candidatus Eremiobacterota bacterium]